MFCLRCTGSSQLTVCAGKESQTPSKGSCRRGPNVPNTHRAVRDIDVRPSLFTGGLRLATIARTHIGVRTRATQERLTRSSLSVEASPLKAPLPRIQRGARNDARMKGGYRGPSRLSPKRGPLSSLHLRCLSFQVLSLAQQSANGRTPGTDTSGSLGIATACTEWQTSELRTTAIDLKVWSKFDSWFVP